MNKFVAFGLLLACVAVAAFFVTASFELAHTGFTLRHDTDLVTAHTVAQVDGLDTAGISQQTRKLLTDTHDLVIESQRTLHQEQSTINSVNRSVTTTMDNIQNLVAHLDASQASITDAATKTLTSASTTLAATTTAVNTANTTLATTSTTIATTNATIADVDKFVNASELKTTVTNVNQMVDIADQVELKATHDYLHPRPMSPLKKAWKAAEPWLLIGGHVAASIY